MNSAQELRAESRRLRKAARHTRDPAHRTDLAARALDLAQRAEAIARSQEELDIVRMNVERYRAMLASGIEDDARRKTIADMLRDAEHLLDPASAQAK